MYLPRKFLFIYVSFLLPTFALADSVAATLVIPSAPVPPAPFPVPPLASAENLVPPILPLQKDLLASDKPFEEREPAASALGSSVLPLANNEHEQVLTTAGASSATTATAPSATSMSATSTSATVGTPYPALQFGPAETSQPFAMELWQSVSMVIFVLAAIGAGGFMVVRLRNRGGFGVQNPERHMSLVSTLAIGPKRSVILLRIRDQEIAVGSTEHGIQFLSDIRPVVRPQKPEVTVQADLPRSLPRRPAQSLAPQASQSQPSAATQVRSHESSPSSESQIRTPAKSNKSEILLGALKNLAPKSAFEKSQASAPRSEPALKQTRASFPKYLANAFEQESKRPLQGVPTTEQADSFERQRANKESEENVESVTNMIRAKLKEMRPLS